MRRTDLKQFVALRGVLMDEHEVISRRIEELDKTLDSMGCDATMRIYGHRTPTGRMRNDQSLREAVLEVLSKGPMRKDEIYEAVLASGYVFSTNDPLNSLGVILYGKNSGIVNKGGVFSLEEKAGRKT